MMRVDNEDREKGEDQGGRRRKRRMNEAAEESLAETGGGERVSSIALLGSESVSS